MIKKALSTMSKRFKVDHIDYSIQIPMTDATGSLASRENSVLVKFRFFGEDGRGQITTINDQAKLIAILRTLTVIQHEIDSL